MSRHSVRSAIVLLAAVICCAALAGEAAKKAQPKAPAWTDPEEATKADPDFAVQGEYVNATDGLQLVALGAGKFYAATLKGGLPGAGWDTKSLQSALLGADDAKKLLAGGWKKVERSSPTTGEKPPAGAVVLFDGKGTSEFDKGTVTPDGLLCEGPTTVKKFKNFKLHLEFRMPYKPAVAPSNQDRGNSGVYIFNLYEVQVLDTFGIHFFNNTFDEQSWSKAFQDALGFKPASDRTQFCAAMYHVKIPELNASFPPLAWQTYDITFTAAKFDGDKKTTNARITVIHNGVKVHNDYELPHGTGAATKKPELPEGVIYFQAHGNPLRFRNMWLVTM